MNKIKEIIKYFVDHDFLPDVVEKVHRRLQIDVDRKDQVEAMSEVWDTMEFTATPAEAEQAYQALERKIIPYEEKSRWQINRWLKIAALWLIPIVSGSVAFYAMNRLYEVSSMTQVQCYVAQGKRECIVLPDGSSVWLNSGTLLMYPNKFVGDTREVYLVGEALFTVQKNEKKPFVVKMEAAQVEVLGTVFSCTAYPNEDYLAITLESGAVKVDISATNQDYKLLPNERLMYCPSNGTVELLKVNAKNYSSWTMGGLRFEGERFDSILRILERRFNVRFELLNSDYTNSIITVTFNENETLPNVMRLIQMINTGMEYKIEENKVIIK